MGKILPLFDQQTFSSLPFLITSRKFLQEDFNKDNAGYPTQILDVFFQNLQKYSSLKRLWRMQLFKNKTANNAPESVFTPKKQFLVTTKIF